MSWNDLTSDQLKDKDMDTFEEKVDSMIFLESKPWKYPESLHKVIAISSILKFSLWSLSRSNHKGNSPLPPLSARSYMSVTVTEWMSWYVSPPHRRARDHANGIRCKTLTGNWKKKNYGDWQKPVNALKSPPHTSQSIQGLFKTLLDACFRYYAWCNRANAISVERISSIMLAP